MPPRLSVSVSCALPYLRTLLCYGLAVLPLPGADLAPGIALFTTVSGEVRLTTGSDAPQTMALHSARPLAGTTIATGTDSHCGLALSNGVGLFLGPGTSIAIADFSQRPFAESENSLHYEPSVSRLQIQLLEGSLALAADRLSPLSEVTVGLRSGTVRTHSARAGFSVREDALALAAYSGNLTLTVGDADRHFIVGGEGLRFLFGAGGETIRSESISAQDLTVPISDLVDAASHASRRVLYRVNDSSPTIPQPVLARPEASFQQASPRPYRFLD